MTGDDDTGTADATPAPVSLPRSTTSTPDDVPPMAPRERPILDEARRKALIAVVGTLVSGGVTFGAITPALADQINGAWAYVLGAVVTLLPLVTSLGHAAGIVASAEPKTTPTSAPRDDAGNPLVPFVDANAATYGEHAADPPDA